MVSFPWTWPDISSQATWQGTCPDLRRSSQVSFGKSLCLANDLISCFAKIRTIPFKIMAFPPPPSLSSFASLTLPTLIPAHLFQKAPLWSPWSPRPSASSGTLLHQQWPHFLVSSLLPSTVPSLRGHICLLYHVVYRNLFLVLAIH